MARKSRSRITPPRRPSANVIATVAVVVIAVAVIGGVLMFNRANDTSAADTGSIPSELRAGTDSNTLTEAEGNKVTVVEFLDYQCPACAAYYANVTKKLESDYAGEITFVTLFDTYATAIGLDLDRFHTDMASAAVAERVSTDMAAGEKLGVSSTPTIYVNGTKFEPRGQSFTDVDRELRDMIDKALG